MILYKMSWFRLLGLLCCILLVQGWWDKGHMLVSQIAYNHLMDTGRHTQLSHFYELVEAFNNLTDGKSNSFAEAAVWADDIKGHGATLFNNYHFTNIAYDPEYTFSGMTQYQRDVNAVNIIKWCQNVLKANRESLTFERAWMARYLLHLVGDIHQPLHSTMMYNATYKTGDLGGNLIKMNRIDGKEMNLHSYFDSIALDQDPDHRIQRPLNDSMRAQIDMQTRDIMAQHSAQSLADLIAKKDSHVWGVESFEMAVEHIYSFTKQHKQLTEDYQSKIRPLLLRQIALAGYRLAEVIADIYA